jgi:hypothetical protein
MKRWFLALALVQILVPVLKADPALLPNDCSLCFGAVADRTLEPLAPIPLLMRIDEADLPKATVFVADAPKPVRRKISAIIHYAIDPAADALQQVDARTAEIALWAQTNGPVEALGVELSGAKPEVLAYALKRLAVTIQGQNAADEILISVNSVDDLTALYETGAQPYFDVVLTSSADVQRVATWLVTKDPGKKIFAVVEPSSPNPLYDLAKALADGATRAYSSAPNSSAEFTSIANANRTFVGDYAYDSTSRAEILDAKGAATGAKPLTFVRGEDLRTVVVPPGVTGASTIVAIPGGSVFTKPVRVDATGTNPITDSGHKGGRFLVGIPPASGAPFLVTVDRNERVDQSVTKETINVKTKRTITIEEIIRNHQAYKSYQESIQPRYVALDTTKLRFALGDGGEAVEATIAGSYFFDPHSKADWVWQDFLINGVRWKYGRIPELPLIQPEKVTELPLDIRLTNEYRYGLVGETDLNGYHVYEVRFSPPPNAPASLPLYRGTVWIDAKSWARIRISMIQLNLSGEVQSNEERVDFTPFATASYLPLTPQQVASTDPRAVIWLPESVSAQQVISAAGRANVVLRATNFTNFRINSPEFDRLHQEATRSDARMVRETDNGLRYLEKRGSGERVVKEGFDTARTFLLGGIHHDEGLQFPVVPLGGIDYFNFNMANMGVQTNVFFAGVIVQASATNPDYRHTRTNLGANFFGIAIPFENSMFRDGVESKGEAVKTLPVAVSGRAGHSFLEFGHADVQMSVTRESYQRSQDTAPDFAVPSDTFVLDPGLELRYDRWGTSVSGYFDYVHRTNWKPWGNLAEYDPKQQNFAQFGAALGKSFYLPKFQRIGVELDYVDGKNLDRFSKYELGFFGSQRVRGVRSGSVRAEKAALAHLSYGFVFSDQFRLETFYDYASIDDRSAGLHRAPFQGLGIGGQTVGPFGTLLRLDLGKTIGKNRQGGFVANVVFLKLFG